MGEKAPSDEFFHHEMMRGGDTAIATHQRASLARLLSRVNGALNQRNRRF